LRPCVTGVVLKWNTMVMFPFCKAKAFAGMPFTVKSVGSTVTGSTGSLTLTMKSVGAVPVITPPQAALVTWQGIEVAVAVGVGVGVAVAVGVGVAVAVGVGVDVAQVSVYCWLSFGSAGGGAAGDGVEGLARSCAAEIIAGLHHIWQITPNVGSRVPGDRAG
jgi:hypothetical protein